MESKILKMYDDIFAGDAVNAREGNMIAEAFANLEGTLSNELESSRERSLALTKLEEAAFFVRQAMTESRRGSQSQGRG